MVIDGILDGAYPTRRFYVLLALSTTIAAFGLLANSPAVILGATRRLLEVQVRIERRSHSRLCNGGGDSTHSALRGARHLGRPEAARLPNDPPLHPHRTRFDRERLGLD
jgi:hypothetical protein